MVSQVHKIMRYICTCGKRLERSTSLFRVSSGALALTEEGPPPKSVCILLLLVKPDAHSCKRWSNGRGTGGRHAKLPKGIRAA